MSDDDDEDHDVRSPIAEKADSAPSSSASLSVRLDMAEEQSDPVDSGLAAASRSETRSPPPPWNTSSSEGSSMNKARQRNAIAESAETGCVSSSLVFIRQG